MFGFVKDLFGVEKRAGGCKISCKHKVTDRRRIENIVNMRVRKRLLVKRFCLNIDVHSHIIKVPLVAERCKWIGFMFQSWQKKYYIILAV